MSGIRIRGISKSALWEAWKAIRYQLKRAPQRDILDFVEYDIDPDVWINRLLEQIRTSEYAPERAARFSVAKSGGFDRVITLPTVPDAVLLRAIVDILYRKSRRAQARHVYFSQSTLSKVTNAASEDAKDGFASASSAGYSMMGKGVFLEWLDYDQYRKHLIFKKIYPYIVVTDVSNFFDSVLYSRVEDSLHGIRAPVGMIPLLFNILEALSLRGGLTPVQRIGLPVDPCDCSRALAHMMLYPHDKRMTSLVGQDAYVRWMDDQNFGVQTRAEGLVVLREVGASLRMLNLAPNTKKSKVLSLAEAKVHFHFRANAALDKLDVMPYQTSAERKQMRSALKSAWKTAEKNAGAGEWPKIVSRFYRYAARARSKMFVQRAKKDLVSMPALVARISDYLRYVVSARDYLKFVIDSVHIPEQVHADVSFQLVDGLLRLSPDKATASELRRFGKSLLDDKEKFVGAAECRALAPLLLLRYGDGRSLRGMFSVLKGRADRLPLAVVRSLCAVVGGSKSQGVKQVQAVASRLMRNHLSEFVRLLERIKGFDHVPGRFKGRVSLTNDAITGAAVLDMRALLAARLIGQCGNSQVKNWLAATAVSHMNAGLSSFEVALLGRLWPRLDHSK